MAGQSDAEYFARDPRFWTAMGHAVVIGALAGGAALAFTRIVRWGTNLIWPQDLDYGLFGGNWTWVAIVGGAGLLVGILRVTLDVPEELTGSLTMMRTASVDRSTALAAIGISIVSLVGGSSLGPFDGAVRSGAALGDWFGAGRRLATDEHGIDVVSGINGSLGAMLTAPFLATLLVVELRWSQLKSYFRVLLPSLTAAVVGFVVMFSVAGDTFLGVFALPGFDLEYWHLLVAVALGFGAAVLSWLLGITVFLCRRLLVPTLTNRIIRATVGGVAVGLIAWAFPLTLASGKLELSTAIAEFDELGLGLLLAVLAMKIVAVAISLTTGFIGGPVMPTLFIGGVGGLAVHAMFPEVPIALAFSCMLVAVPGISLGAPFSMLFLVGLTVGLGGVESIPAGIAVITAYTLHSGVGWFGLPTEKTTVDIDEPSVQAELFELGRFPPSEEG